MTCEKIDKPLTMFVLGGCRSGKSKHAEQWVSGHFAERKTFIATLETRDDPEMAHRVALHRQARGMAWRTVEEPIALAAVLKEHRQATDVFLIDCLTLWITNLMLRNFSDEQIEDEIKNVLNVIAGLNATVVLVANEVGLGIVPENGMARRFRDLAGWTNQQVAKDCSKVIFMVAGQALVVKDEGD